MEKENTQHYIIFDINSSSIGVLVFEKKFDKKTKKNIYHEIFTKRTNITKGQSYSVDVFLKKTLATLRSLADSAHKYSGNTIAAIYMNMSERKQKEAEISIAKEFGTDTIDRVNAINDNFQDIVAMIAKSKINIFFDPSSKESKRCP